MVFGVMSVFLLGIAVFSVPAIACGLAALRRSRRAGAISRVALAGTLLGTLTLLTFAFLVVSGLYDDVILG